MYFKYRKVNLVEREMHNLTSGKKNLKQIINGRISKYHILKCKLYLTVEYNGSNKF